MVLKQMTFLPKSLLLVALGGVLASCASVQSLPSKQAASHPSDLPSLSADASESLSSDSTPSSSSRTPSANPKQRPVVKYDFPIVRNQKVDMWIDYFTTRGRDWFQKALDKGARYIPIMQEILASYDLPHDLVYLALIESGFKKQAYSRAKAAGQWQFIRSTGRLYGLDSNLWIDERRDPLKATEAAAKYLKNLYDEFGDWYLATAAYNTGEGRIRRGIKQFKTKDFWTLCKYRFLARETKNYVPKLIAAIILAKNYRDYGFSVPAGIETYSYAAVLTERPVSLDKLSRVINLPKEELRYLNAELKLGVTPPGRYEIKVPVRFKDLAAMNLSQAFSDMASEEFVSYRVKRGDTLFKIAHKHGTHVSTLMTLNRLTYRKAKQLQLGQRIVVPANLAGRNFRSDVRTDLQKPFIYTVKRGDSLYRIAKRYGLSIQSLALENNLKIHEFNALPVGKKIKIPRA
jgi:membrane-bound lytic murein transglycosylase D